MEDKINALKRAMVSLDNQIVSKRTTNETLSGAIITINTRLDKIVASVASAREEAKIPTIVCVDEINKLKGDLTTTMVADNGQLMTLLGQRSGLEAAISFLEKESIEAAKEEESARTAELNVQRTKERLESGDLNLDRPRSLGSRPESLKNIRKAQEEISKSPNPTGSSDT